MKIIGNILWFLLEGLWLAMVWALAGIVMCITIVGIPLGIQCFKLAGFVLFPFGKQIQYGGGAGRFLLNLLWILLFGWELAPMFGALAMSISSFIVVVNALRLNTFKAHDQN